MRKILKNKKSQVTKQTIDWRIVKNMSPYTHEQIICHIKKRFKSQEIIEKAKNQLKKW